MRTKSTRVFRTVWRANAILILLVGVASACMVGYSALTFLVWRSADHATIVTRPKPGAAEPRLDLGNFETIDGVDFAVAPIQSVQEGGEGFSSSKWGGSTAVRNYLFLNLADTSSRTLFPDHQQLILAKSLICGEQETNSTRCKRIKWIEYHVVSNDSDGDGRLSAADRMTVGFSTAEGTGYRAVLTGIDSILYSLNRTSDTMLVVYSKDGKNVAAAIDIPAGKVTAEKPLPEIKTAGAGGARTM